MKRLIAIALTIFTLPAMAAPFLTADPYPKTELQPDRFDLLFDAATVPVSSPAILCNAEAVADPIKGKVCTVADDSVRMLHDLGGLTKGTHTVTAKACEAVVGCSASSSSFSFDTAVPAIPSGMRLVP